jgi:hypothetical protein
MISNIVAFFEANGWNFNAISQETAYGNFWLISGTFAVIACLFLFRKRFF